MKTKAFAALACIFICTSATYLAPEESGPPRILRPLDKSVLAAGPLEIAIIVPSASEPPSVLLDGQKLNLSSPASGRTGKDSPSPPTDAVFLPPALVIVRCLSPGLHKLSAGETTLQFFILDEQGKERPPSGWSRYTPHPPPDSEGITCVRCHELSEKRRFLNMNTAFSLEKPTACFDCHERTGFNLTHNHRYESLAFCQMCHDPHGATRDHLLKTSREKACSLCHD